MSENKQTVLDFIRAFSAGDAAAADRCLGPDAMTLAKGQGRLCGIRHRHTILETTAAFKQLIPNGLSPDIVSTTEENDQVVVEFVGNATLINGEDYNNEYCMVFTMKEGKIHRVNEYFCTALAEERLAPLLPPTPPT